MSTLTLTVGTVPYRKGKWLGRQDGGSWHALAKFRNDEAAEEFLRIIRLAGVPEAVE